MLEYLFTTYELLKQKQSDVWMKENETEEQKNHDNHVISVYLMYLFLFYTVIETHSFFFL